VIYEVFAPSDRGRLDAAPQSLASTKCEEVRIDHVSILDHHSVGEAGANLQRAMLEQFCLQ
jgi:hypothetical protein